MDQIASALFPILAGAQKLIAMLANAGIIAPANQTKFETLVNDIKQDCLNGGMDTNSIQTALNPPDLADT